MTQIISDADRDNFLRLPTQGLKLYLSVYRPDTVWEGTLDSAVFPAGFVTVSTTSGTIGDVLEGYTMNVYAAGGEFKGWLRVRKDNSVATQIDISEIGVGYLDIQASDVLKVTPWRRPTAKYHRYDTASAEWLADYDLPIDDNHTNIGPLARVGPPAVGFRDGSGNTTLKFVGSASETYTGGGSISTYGWLWPESNNAATAGTPGSPHSIVFNDAHPKGAEYSLEVTDSAGETHRRYGVMWTHNRDGANAPYKVAQVALDTTLGQGALCQMFLYGEFTEAQLPRDAYIVLWSEINYGGTIKDDIGGTYPFRANVLFAGYVVNETQVVTGLNDEKFTEVKAASIDTVMQSLATYPIEQISIPGSSSDWSNIKDLTVERGTASLTKWRAHLDMIDVNTGDYSDDQPINFLDPPEGTLWEQFEYNYLNTLMGRVGVSLGGDLYGNADHQLTPDAHQWLSSPSLNIEQADLAGELRINYRSYPDTAQVNMSGVDGDDPLYSQAPGSLKGYIGTPVDQPPGFAPVDQADLNEMTGKLLSYNNRLIESVTIPIGYYVHLDANPQTLVDLTISTVDHPRGYDDFASGKDLLITRVRFDYTDDFDAFTTIDCEPAIERTNPGVTIIMPQTPATNFDDFAMPSWEYDNAWAELPLPNEPIDSANASQLMALSDAGSALSNNLDDVLGGGTAVYESINAGLPDDANIRDMAFLSGENTVYICISSDSLQTAGIYKRENAWNSGSTWELQMSEAEYRDTVGVTADYGDGLSYHFGGVNFAEEFVYVSTSYGLAGNDHRRFVVFDGSSWSINAIYDTYAAGPPGSLTAFVASANNAGVVFAPVHDSGFKIAKSTDFAATFSTVGASGSFITSYNLPFESNSSDNVHWFSLDDGTIKRSTNAAVSSSTITMPGGWSGIPNRRSIHSFTSDSDIIAITSSPDGKFAISTNGNAGTPTFTLKTAVGGINEGLGGWPDNSLWFSVAGQDNAFVTDDGAVTWNDAIGNLAALGFGRIRWIIPRFSI